MEHRGPSGFRKKMLRNKFRRLTATCTTSSVIQHMFIWQAQAWAGHPENNNALLLIIASSLAMGLTMLGLVLVARDTNILSCFVWSRGKVTNSRSQEIRFKSGLARLTSLEELCLDSDICRVRDMLIKRNVSILSKGEGDYWNIGVQSGLKRKY